MSGYYTAGGMGAIDDKITGLVNKAGDKLGLRKYTDKLLQVVGGAADDPPSGVPITVNPAPVVAAPEPIPLATYAVGGIILYLIAKAVL